MRTNQVIRMACATSHEIDRATEFLTKFAQMGCTFDAVLDGEWLVVTLTGGF